MNRLLVKSVLPLCLATAFLCLIMAMLQPWLGAVSIQAAAHSDNCLFTGRNYKNGNPPACPTDTPSSTPTPTLETTWNDTCVNYRMDITGIGMGDAVATINPVSLPLANSDQITWLLAQVAGRYTTSKQTPASVIISSAVQTPVTLTNPTRDTAYGYTFETNLQPSNQITAWVNNIGGDTGTLRGLIAYAKRNTSSELWTSVGRTSSAFVYWDYQEGYHSEELIFSQSLSRPTDIDVTAAVIDNNVDERPLVLEARAGPVIASSPPITGPTEGDLLNIVSLTLPNVPADTDRVTVTLRSPHPPPVDGDSLVLMGVNAGYRCVNLPSGLTITKTVNNKTPAEGDTITYTITVTNNTPNIATGVRVIDRLPNLVIHQSHNPPAAYDPDTNVWEVGNLGRDESATLQLTAQVARCTGGRRITNTATLTAAQSELVAENNEVSVGITPISTTHCLYLPIVLKAPPPPCYTETFTNPYLPWRFDTSPGPPTLLEYLYGRYHMFTQDTNVSHWARSRRGPYYNYTVEVEVKWANSTYIGEGHGIVFDIRGEKPHTTYYRFNIKTDITTGTYVLDKIQGDSRTRLVSSTSSSIITGTVTNTLKIKREGYNIEMYINGEYQQPYYDRNNPLPQPGYAGVDIVPYDEIDGEAFFDNFRICSYEINGESINGLSGVNPPSSGIGSK